jgi:SAM-dependent methyltransferase
VFKIMEAGTRDTGIPLAKCLRGKMGRAILTASRARIIQCLFFILLWTATAERALAKQPEAGWLIYLRPPQADQGWIPTEYLFPDQIRAHVFKFMHFHGQTAIVRRGGAVEVAKGEKRLRRNQFVIVRSMYQGQNGGYSGLLGPLFRADVEKWHAGMKILDAGAGTCGFYNWLIAKNGPATPEMVAVGAKMPEYLLEGNLRGPKFNPPPGVTYYEGCLASDGALEKKLREGTFDRIVDAYGASHYVTQFDKIIESYGRLLKPGGMAFLHFNNNNGLTLLDADGKLVGTIEYLSRVKGMRVIYSRQADALSARFDNNQGLQYLVLERVGKGPVIAPPLRAASFINSAPPDRTYWDDNAPKGRLGQRTSIRAKNVLRRSAILDRKLTVAQQRAADLRQAAVPAGAAGDAISVPTASRSRGLRARAR